MKTQKMKASPRVLSLSWRRAAVVINYLSYPFIGLFLGDWLTSSKFVNVAGVLIAAVFLFGTFIYLYIGTQLWNLGNAPDKDLDERQIQVRNNAYRYAYMIIATLMMFVGIYYTIAVDKGHWLPNTYDQANFLLWGVILLALSLPSAILAWTEPEV